MSINPIHGAPTAPTQGPQPAAPTNRQDHDGDRDDAASATKSTPPPHAGGIVDHDA